MLYEKTNIIVHPLPTFSLKYARLVIQYIHLWWATNICTRHLY